MGDLSWSEAVVLAACALCIGVLAGILKAE